MIIRPMTDADLDSVVELQSEAFPPPFPKEYQWTREPLEGHLRRFPDGQFVGEENGLVVASCSNAILPLARWERGGSWDELLGGRDSQSSEERILFGLDISVARVARRQGVGRSFYGRRFELVRELGLARYGTICRMPDLHRTEMPAADYAAAVARGELEDRTLTPLLRMGVTLVGVVEGFMRDEESMNAGARLEWRP